MRFAGPTGFTTSREAKSGGGHAYRENEEFVVALSGSFDAVLHNGVQQRRFSLNRSYYGLYIPKMTWRTLENFSTNALALVLSSTVYDPEDYIRTFDEFIAEMHG